jgi:hypothetical protein
VSDRLPDLMRSRVFLSLACLSSMAPWLLGARTAAAEDVAAADALFNTAIADMEAGRYDVACPALAESQRLDPRSGTLFAVATCNAKAGKIATALAFYDDYLRSVGELPAAAKSKHAERMKIARAELDRIRPLIPTLKLVLPAPAPLGARVRRDGIELSAASLGIALPIDPGQHVVTLEVPGRAPAEHRFTVDRGQTKVVELTLGAVTPAAGARPSGSVVAPSPAPAAGVLGDPRRFAAYAAGVFGGASLVVGAVAGGLALSKKKVVDADCPSLHCTSAGEAALDTGRTLGTVSTAFVSLAAAGLAAGAILFFTAPNAAKPDDKAARWEGGFSAGPDGAAMTVKGVW